MTPDEFRRHGREVIDWIADYLEQVEQRPVLSQVKPGEIRSRLPERPPQQGEPFAAILRDVNEIIMPGITHWQSPNFFAYFPSNNSGPSILGDLLASGLGCRGCCGRPARPARNWKRTFSIGSWRPWACRNGSFRRPSAAA